jgi:hypothetical protein
MIAWLQLAPALEISSAGAVRVPGLTSVFVESVRLQELEGADQRQRQVGYLLRLEVAHRFFEEAHVGEVRLDQHHLVEALDQRVGGVAEGEDINVVVVAESVEDVVDDVTRDLAPHSRHRAGPVHQDDHVFGGRGSFDVPGAGAAVEQVDGVLGPDHGCKDNLKI